ncbi:DNA mismatch repair protein MutL [Lachnospiraceae bacterium PF1-22]|uniref:DNA mismatch repair endonuclease MutL n=1 Tax=Ohessyouella blattaphilus TaxID=2949333 RepID=UPI003E30CEDA
MAKINVLDQITIDKIAAGEVVERPASIVKELVENAIDAGATTITVEITDGGISSIRVIDDGEGIAEEDIRKAFLRHSTSKISDAGDLTTIATLGFRGEALSSIAAISMVRLTTKTHDRDYGSLYEINGGSEASLSQVGAPNGTTFEIQQIFYNTPARRKFLKTPITEASHISDLLTRLSLSHPEISFQFVNNHQTKLHTTGSGDLKDVIYHLYGREVASNIRPVTFTGKNLTVTGFVGNPSINRGNRNFENFFVGGRYIKSNLISKAIEDAYKEYTMQHRYPFACLLLSCDPELVDVNVHPTKMEVRFANTQQVYEDVYEAVHQTLKIEEHIPQVEAPLPVKTAAENSGESVPSMTPTITREAPPVREVPPAKEERDLEYYLEEMKRRVNAYHEKTQAAPVSPPVPGREEVIKPSEPVAEIIREKPEVNEQLNLFQEKFIQPKAASTYKFIGQLFETYWLIQYQESLYIIDQHAAHEKVLYEKTLKEMRNRDYTTQMISPPIVLNLSMKEAQLLQENLDSFLKIGFEIEAFGPDSYKVSGVPGNLFSVGKKDLLLEMLDELSEEFNRRTTTSLIDEKIASISCKAAVKGNMQLNEKEMRELIDELLELDNPYHCPHGRPTIIAMTKREIEKKFKRIV